jgi:hypothetical protein
VYLKFDNRSGKLIRSSRRNEAGIKKGGRNEMGKGGKETANEDKENIKEECVLFSVV